MKNTILLLFFAITYNCIAQIPTSGTYTIAPTIDGKPHFIAGKISIGTSNINSRLYIEDNTSNSSDNNPAFGRFVNLAPNSGVRFEFATSTAPNAPKFEVAQNSPDYGIGTSLAVYGNKSTLTARNGSGMIIRAINAQSGVFDGIIFQSGVNSPDGSTVERMRLDGNGNLGIGTSNPQQKLHVVGNGLLSKISINTNTIANKLYIEDNSAGGGYPDSRVFAAFKNTNTSSTVSQQFIVGNDGFLEIGYLGSQYGGIGSQLNTIYGNFSTIQARGGSKGLILRADASSFESQEGIIKFLAGFGGLGAPERMRISSNGFVGIGTQNPNFKLHVEDGTLQVANGNIRVQAGDVYVTESTSGLILKSPNGTCWRVTIDDFGNFNRNTVACPLN